MASLLMGAGLLDELRIFVHPIILRGGIPLFGKGTKARLKPRGARAFSSGLVELCYAFK